MVLSSYITDDFLLEGIVGATFWYMFIIRSDILRLEVFLGSSLSKMLGISLSNMLGDRFVSILGSLLPWFLVWLMRKFFVSFYKSYKKKYNIENKKLYIFS